MKFFHSYVNFYDFVILHVRLIWSWFLSLLEGSLIFLFFLTWKEIMESLSLYTLFFCQYKRSIALLYPYKATFWKYKLVSITIGEDYFGAPLLFSVRIMISKKLHLLSLWESYFVSGFSTVQLNSLFGQRL